MRVTSLFRPKFMRRIVLLLAMCAPIVYLFGTQFLALAGAHGEEVLANYHEEWQEVNTVEVGEDYKFVWGVPSSLTYKYWVNPFKLEDGSIGSSVEVGTSAIYYSMYGSYFGVYTVSGGWFDSNYQTLFFTSMSDSFSLLPYGTLYRNVIVKDDSADYSNALFGSFFPRGNFIEQLGANALADEHGFHALNQFLAYCDTFLDLSHSQLGLMAYGYISWVCYVLMCNLVSLVLVWLFTFPVKVYDKIQGGIDL